MHEPPKPRITLIEGIIIKLKINEEEKCNEHSILNHQLRVQ